MATTAAPLTKAAMKRIEAWRFHQFTLKANQTAFKGGVACIQQSDGKCYAGALTTGLIPIGLFAEDLTSTADALVNVDLLEEKTLVWMKNSTSGDAVAATDFGKVCYLTDDNKVTITSTGASKAGRVWGVDTAKGVLVELGRDT